MHRSLVLLLLLGLLLIGAGPGSPPRVESFSPEGLAKAVRQVAVRFSQPMVAFGDPRPRTELFRIDCPEPGLARWVDERSWVYDFARDLPAGVRCRFVLMPELRSLAGARLGGRREFSFDTGGPAIGTSMPWRGARIAEDQRFVLRLDAAPDEASVAAHAFFRVDGVVDPIGVRVVTGAERDETLRRQLREPTPGDLLIEARQRFPAGRQLELVWGPGVATTTGVATREAQRIPFRTRDALGLEISCPRENARADCLPLGKLELRFSAPMDAAAASQIRLAPLEAPAGEPVRVAEPSYEAEGAEYVQSWRIRGPFAPNSRFLLELPAVLRDDAGRSLAPLDASLLEIRV
ncbi:MAG: alpha-2-macroglobulin, partial [Myxococcota bacterium]